jgi:hypothetical protein
MEAACLSDQQLPEGALLSESCLSLHCAKGDDLTGVSAFI